MKKALLLILAGPTLFGAGCRTVQPPWDGALSAEDQALAEAMAYYAQGLIHEAELGWHSEATLQAFAKAAERAPNQYRVQYNLALAHFHQQRIDTARAVLERFSKRNPGHALSKLDLAAFAQAGGDTDAAIRHYREALRHDPPLVWPYLDLARLLFQKQNDGEALMVLAKAMRRTDEPAVLQFCYDHGRLFLSNGEYERAIGCFELIAENTDPERLTPSFLLQHGAAYERSGQFEKAEAVFKQCLAVYPRTHEVLNYLAYMWAERGLHLDQALDYVKQALEQQPDNGAYVDTLGWIYYQMGRYPEALEQLKKANRLMPDDPTITDHVGDAYHALTDRENAIRFWKQSYALDPDNAEVVAKLEAEGIRPEPPTPKPNDEKRPHDE